MHIARSVAELRQRLASADHPAFVPTMGNLHEGHLALLRHANTLGDQTVASIFVNRLQFLPHEDFDSYPRTFESDCAQLEAVGCDVLFAPSEQDLYPQPQTFKIQPDPALANILEGEYRPGFFTGVCTVVMKLFSCVFQGGKGVAIFGQKDFQQQLILRHMVRQFALPIDIVTVPTLRAADGLALSSRNMYLSDSERAQAVQLSAALKALFDKVNNLLSESGSQAEMLPGQSRLRTLETQAMDRLRALGWQPDYLTVRHQADLSPLDASGRLDPLIALGAAKLGKTRLIDNLLV
ncbi:MAG: pantoate--beta-alanine ligase [Betaproteobacteria bacterium]|nr:pantoate--beta-alanine ligase [Betaproteobacteria bacterium]